MTTKVKQSTRNVSHRTKSAVKKVGAAKRPPKVQHTQSHTNPHTPKKGGGRGKPVGGVNPMPQIVEYPGESKGRSFGHGVKVVSNRG